MRLKLLLLILISIPLFGRTSATGWCSKGGQVVMTRNASSTTLVMRSYPSCTVTVLTSLGGMATLYSDNMGTPLSNPFTGNSIGQWTFFADPDEYSVTLSGALINAPFTIQMYVAPDVGPSGTGITSLNGLNANTQFFATGTTGVDFNIVSATATHTFNLPTASATNRGALSSADWSAFNAKQGALSFTAPLVNTAGTVALTLPLAIGQGGTGQITQTLGFNALSPLTTRGDTLAFNGTNNIRLPVGTDGQVLSADSGQATGLKWITNSAGGAGNPAGATTELQFNNGGVFGGTAGFTWTPANPGLSLNLVDPSQGNDPNDRRAVNITCTFGNISVNPGFADENCLQLTQTNLMGQNSYGGGTNAKTTFLPVLLSTTNYSAGQRFTLGINQTCYGMGDCALYGNNFVHFAGANISGDEGEGVGLAQFVGQQDHLTTTTIATVPVRNSCNTTLTQNVIASIASQTVTVASSAGCTGWIVLGHTAATNTPNVEAVNVTVATGSITGIFRNNHTNGDSVLPATLFTVASGASEFGQDRVLVNLSGTSYTTGTVSSISMGAQFNGMGTTWTNGMVGGDSTNPGCVSLTNDNVTLPNAQVLRSWYEISSRISNTAIDIYTTSVAGDAAYRGNGVGAGAYVIRPCARVLYLLNSGGSLNGQVVLDTNSFTWTNGDSVELAISPYPDMSGHQEIVAAWTPGGTYRAWYEIRNNGFQKFTAGFLADTQIFQGSGSAFTAAFQASGNGQIDYGLDLGGVQTLIAALRLPAPTAGEGACIMWGPGTCSAARFIGPTVDMSGADTNSLQISFINSGSAAILSGTQVGGKGAFDFSGGTITLHDDSGAVTNGPSLRIKDNAFAAILQNTNASLTADRTITFPDRAGTLGVFGNATTGGSTETFTNSPCSMAPTVPQWIPVTVTGLSGTYYISVCH